MMKPWKYLPPVEIPGVGQVHGDLIEDDATMAEMALENCGAAYAYQNYRERLQSMIDQRTWRSEAAFDILASIIRSLEGGLANLSEYKLITFDEPCEEHVEFSLSKQERET